MMVKNAKERSKKGYTPTLQTAKLSMHTPLLRFAKPGSAVSCIRHDAASTIGHLQVVFDS